jgi:predicted transcriptional regulator of viral defense system
MSRSRMQIAKADIVSHFDGLSSHVLKLKEIRSVLAEQRGFWRLAQNTTAAQFVSFLEKHSKLKLYEFPFPQRGEKCYAWGEIPLLTILLSLKKGLHFSHYTAMRMQGLTEQLPKSVYLTDERTTSHPTEREKLSQSDIDHAFKHSARISSNWVEYDDKKIYLLNGADTGHLGVVVQQASDEDGQEAQVRVTNIERTLIDATVKPMYAGGVFEVAKAFALANDRLSVNKLMPMLRKLDFAYPYHQAIGYYLERAGYKSSQLDLVRRLPMEHDFYLTHEMGETRYEPTWRLFVPNGF